MSGVRAELAVDAPRNCPAARQSAAGGPVTDVTWTRTGDVVTEEYATTEGVTGEEPLVAYGDREVYRTERDGDHQCVCERIEARGHPVADARARDGTLVLTVHFPDTATVREVVEELRESGADVELRRLTGTGPDPATEAVPVDRARLTERQREVLERAEAMGYFRHPRESNATEVAASLDIGPSTFAEHLAAAEAKVMDDLFG
jgi:predicted DNA binding protein